MLMKADKESNKYSLMKVEPDMRTRVGLAKEEKITFIKLAVATRL